MLQITINYQEIYQKAVHVRTYIVFPQLQLNAQNLKKLKASYTCQLPTQVAYPIWFKCNALKCIFNLFLSFTSYRFNSGITKKKNSWRVENSPKLIVMLPQYNMLVPNQEFGSIQCDYFVHSLV